MKLGTPAMVEDEEEDEGETAHMDADTCGVAGEEMDEREEEDDEDMEKESQVNGS